MEKTIKYRLHLWFSNPFEGFALVWSLDTDEATVWELDDDEVWRLD